MSYFPYRFEGEIVHHDVGSETYAYTVVFLPGELAQELPLKAYPRLRISGEIGEHPFEAALTPVRGSWYILLSRKMLRALGSGVGDIVEVCFDIADQDAVDIPKALQEALSANGKMDRLWKAQTAGKQRGLAYRVASAKTLATQNKRITEVFGILSGKLDMRGKPVD